MKKGTFIDKENRSEFHLDINDLYNEGVSIIQSYSSDYWTDFNEHDPGVTILENVVFAITDLCSRMGYDTADYLLDEQGNLDLENQSLFEPKNILTSHPVTIADLRKILIDSVEEVSNLWIEPRHDNLKVKGLYNLFVLPKQEIYFSTPDPDYHKSVRDTLRKKIIDTWSGIRNLGEDLAIDGISVLEKKDIYVHTRIVVESNSSFEEILAGIILQIDGYFNPQIIPKTIEEMLSDGHTLDQIYEGPLLSKGFIADESLEINRPVKITKAKILSLIARVSGIAFVEELSLSDSDESPISAGEEEIRIEEGFFPRLCFETNKEDPLREQQLLKRHNRTSFLTISLQRKNSKKFLDVSFDETIKILRRNQAIKLRVYTLQTDAKEKSLVPNRRFKDFKTYYSIQNQFPAIYAINQYGISKYEPADRQAQALQLKAYLLLFEQILANLAAQIGNLKSLYSTRELTKSYYFQPLTESQIHDLEKLYLVDFDLDREELSGVLNKFLARINATLPHLDRKSRALDYLLAIYGEKFSQRTLSRVGGITGRINLNVEMDILENKASMLKHLQYFNRNSSKAPSYSAEPDVRDMSGFEVKLAILLGMNPELLVGAKSLFDNINTNSYDLILLASSNPESDPRLEWLNEAEMHTDFIRSTENKLSLLSDFDEPDTSADTRSPLSETLFIKHGFMPDFFLKTGGNPQNYRIYKKSGRFNLIVSMAPNENMKWYKVSAYNHLSDAVRSGYKLAEVVKQMSTESEKFTIIDHILLRPQTDGSEVPLSSESLEFHSFTCSLIFSGWSARFVDPYFRHLAEETVLFNIPAHIEAEVHWLDPSIYRQFESIFLNWQQERCEDSKKSMKEFLQNLKEPVEAT